MTGTFTATYIKTIPLGPDTIMVLYSWLAATGNTGAAITSSSYLSSIKAASYSNNVTANGVQLQENYNAGVSAGDITVTCTANDGGTLTLIGSPRRV